jgi:hypothetical protein
MIDSEHSMSSNDYIGVLVVIEAAAAAAAVTITVIVRAV